MDSFREVLPALPAAPYIGGKRNLAQRLVERIERTPHDRYIEPFVGMGGVFFRRRRVPRVEVINDLSRDVATFFRVLQRHYVAFVEMIRWQVTSRTEFERLIRVDVDTLTDLERSARFLYLQRTAFGGKVRGRNFGVATDRPARFDVTQLVPMLEDLHERLAGVVIECLPYGELLDRYDRPGSLFYLDPPYAGCESDYGTGLFEAEDFERLADRLRRLKGRFVLSINDTPAMRDTFARFKTERVRTTYTLGGRAAKPAAELVVTDPQR